jgi:predicted nucleic acid-binding protein
MSAGVHPRLGRRVLIDTSVWIEAFAPGGEPSGREAVHDLVSSGRAATCEVVIAEVLRGAPWVR